MSESIDIYAGTEFKDHKPSPPPHLTFWEYNLQKLFGTLGKLTLFPSCCGYAIYRAVNNAAIEKNTKEFIKILKANQENDNGFGAIICTVNNEASVKKLKENGWEKTHNFVNPGTGKVIYTLQLTL